MGCGSSNSASIPESSSFTQDTMICDMCQSRLSFINRKKTCVECGNCFCGVCLPREAGKTRTCSRCKVLVKKPGERTELMKLRVKDLQNYLCRKKINIKSCVEKKDLVELVLQTNGDSNDISRTHIPPSRSWEDTTIRVSDQVPLERSSNFPRSYVESSHRREFFERFGNPSVDETSENNTEQGPSGSSPSPAAPGDDVMSLDETPIEPLDPPSHSQEANGDEETPVEAVEISVEAVETPVEAITTSVSPVDRMSLDGRESNENDVQSIVVEDEEVIEVSAESLTTSENVPEAHATSDGAFGGTAEEADRTKSVDQSDKDSQQDREEDTKEEKNSSRSSPVDISGHRLRPDLLPNQTSKSVPSSPRRFANQGVVYLSEIQSTQDLRELSAKQVKEILAMNRVNFKGCVEKEELLKIVERLWNQERRAKEEIDTMEDDSLCKICMDAPIDCVMLECGHMCTCTNCGKQMAECPICRQYVVRVVRTFKA